MMKIVLVEHTPELYTNEDGWIMRREYGSTTNGSSINGKWVLRDPKGNMVGFDKYCSDLAEAHNVVLKSV